MNFAEVLHLTQYHPAEEKVSACDGELAMVGTESTILLKLVLMRARLVIPKSLRARILDLACTHC